MPSVTLTTEDISKLSPSTVEEIYSLFPESASVGGVQLSDKPEEVGEDGDFFPLTKRLASKCLAKPLDPKSVQLLKLLAQHNGRVLWSIVRKSLGLSRWQDLRGVLSGLNRRLRSVTGDSDAYLVNWDASEDEVVNGEYIDGYLKVHSETASSLRSYFGFLD